MNLESPGHVTASGGAAGGLLAVFLLGPAALAARLPARGDLTDFFWPMKSYTAARWAAGQIPLWNPLAGCGEPWLAQLQSGGLYPGDLPFLLPLPWGALLAIALHLALAGAGMARWLDSLGASRAAALAGAVVYAGGGGFLSLVPVYNNACSAAWLPWIFVGARRVLSGGAITALALPVALGFLAGEPSLTVVGTVAAVALAGATRTEGAGRPGLGAGETAVRTGGALLLAAGLTAAVSLPFADHVVRTGRVGGATPDESVARPLGIGTLADLLVPPSSEATRRPTGERGGYLASLAMGPLPFLLLAAAGAGFPGRPRLLLGLLLLAAIGVLLALGARGVLTPLLYRVGIMRGLRFPARWFALAHLAFAAGAGAGLDGWLYGRFRGADEGAGPTPARLPLRPAWPVALTAVGIVALLVLAAGVNAADRDPRRTALVVGVAVVAALALLVRPRVGAGEQATGLLVVIVLGGSLVVVAADPLDSVPASRLSGATERARRTFGEAPGRTLVDLFDPRAIVAYASPEGRWTPDTPVRERGMLAGYANLDVRVPAASSGSPLQSVLRLRLFRDSLAGRIPDSILRLSDVRHVFSTTPPARAPRTLPAGRGEGFYAYHVAGPLGRAFFARRGRVVPDETALGALTHPGFDPESEALFADDPGPIPPPRQGHGYSALTVVRDLAEETELSTASSEPAIVVLTRSWDPGWRVEIDGLPTRAVRTDLFFLGFTLPAGEHRVVLRYRPLAFRVGAAISAVSALLALGLLLAGAPEPRLP